MKALRGSFPMQVFLSGHSGKLKGGVMKIEIRLKIATDDDTLCDEEILSLDKPYDQLETLGLSLNNAKEMLHLLQQHIVTAQAAAFAAEHRYCTHCGRTLVSKDSTSIQFRTPFGDIPIQSPRFYHCACHPADSKTFSPLTALFSEHVAPELLYLETKWASLVPFGVTVDLIKDVLPVGATLNAETVRHHLHRVAERIESELGEEQEAFINATPAMLADLPEPEGPIVVGMDGGYVRDRDKPTSHFEVMVGQSIPEDRGNRYFGLVQSIDDKPKIRLHTVLREQGLQMNQDITFLTDGGDTVRNMAFGMSPCAEHILDWFHITMRLTVLGQYAKGLTHDNEEEGPQVERELKRIKGYLWNGNHRKALPCIEVLADDLDVLESDYASMKAFRKAAAEFYTYIRNNAHTIPNYAERHRYGERVSTAFAESTVNVVVGKRFNKRQQMRWSKQGAHWLLQTRTRTLDGTLRSKFEEWYPGLAGENGDQSPLAMAA
jgi:hypothetical protein